MTNEDPQNLDTHGCIYTSPQIEAVNQMYRERNLAKAIGTEIMSAESLLGEVIGLSRKMALNKDLEIRDRLTALNIMRQATTDCLSLYETGGDNE